MRKIIHIDMDCFYAAVEMRDDPSLRNVPIAVGGSREKRGVISTCNYQARAFGVRSAMPTGQALKLCPQLVLVKGRMDVYQQVSRQIRAIFADYTDKIEPLSLDEAYLDVTDCTRHQGSATRIAEEIRQRIFHETQLTASAGVASCKFVAKIASDENKPNGLCVITPAMHDQFVRQLPLKKIPGVGKVTADKLASMGLQTCQDVRDYPLEKLLQRFGKFGPVLWERSHGIDQRSVNNQRQRKSVGVETTLAEDIASFEECWQVVERLFPKLQQRLQKATGSAAIHTQGLKLKFADFQQTTVEHRQTQLNQGFFDGLLHEALTRQQGRRIRLVGITVGLPTQHASVQMDLPLDSDN